MNRIEKSVAIGLMGAAFVGSGCGGSKEKFDANCNPNLTLKTYQEGIRSGGKFLANVLIAKNPDSAIGVEGEHREVIKNPLVVCWNGVKAYVGREGIDTLSVIGIHSNDINVIIEDAAVQTGNDLSKVARIEERVVYAQSKGNIFTRGFNDTQSNTLFGETG